jgi:hypothetical protein
MEGIARKASPRSSGSSVSMAATRPLPKPSPARMGSASAMVCINAVTSWRGLPRRRNRTAEAPKAKAAAMFSRPIWVISLTESGSTLADSPSPNRASASISGCHAAHVKQKDRRLAARLPIGGQHRAQLPVRASAGGSA